MVKATGAAGASSLGTRCCTVKTGARHCGFRWELHPAGGDQRRLGERHPKV